MGEEHGITDELLQAFRDEAQKPAAQADAWQQALDNAQAETNKLLKVLAKLDDDSTFDQRKALQAKAEAINPALKAAVGARDDGDGDAFVSRMREIHSELAELNTKAGRLSAAIQARLAELIE